MGFNAFLALSLRILLQWENRKLDAKYGKRGNQASGPGQSAAPREKDAQMFAAENYGPGFRYVL